MPRYRLTVEYELNSNDPEESDIHKAIEIEDDVVRFIKHNAEEVSIISQNTGNVRAKTEPDEPTSSKKKSNGSKKKTR